jgi:hypothetical protein
MKRIEVKLALPVVAPLLDVVRGLADDLRAGRAAPAGLADLDPEFRVVWSDELLQGQRDEVDALLGLFDGTFFQEGVVAFDAGNAEIILRACAVVRLRLREKFLAGLGDEVLETGDLQISRLEEPVRRAFMCYLFLATLQELIIQHLDEGILGG